MFRQEACVGTVMCNNISVNIVATILPKYRNLQGNSTKIEHRWEIVTIAVRTEDVLDPTSTEKKKRTV